MADQQTALESVRWDLTDLYAGTDDPTIDADLDRCDRDADALVQGSHGKVKELDAAGMADLVAGYEDIQERAANVGIYAQLAWTVDTQSPETGALLQRVTERGSKLEQKLLFFELEWAALDDERAATLLDDDALVRWRHFLTVARLYRPHLLSEPEERILSETAVTGRDAWTRYYDELHTGAEYRLDGEVIQREVLLSKLHGPDREERRSAAAAVTEGLQKLLPSSTFIFNTLMADKASNDSLRSYESWVSSRNLSNQVDDATVDALVDATTSRYDVVRRYYELKKRLMGLDELFDYDRYAPLQAAERTVGWDDARDVVLAAYKEFHPTLHGVGTQFFDNAWIDAPVQEGKRGGAFAMPGTPQKHAYLLLNYEGRPRDVMTLAHELGHGVHQMLYRERGWLNANTPLTTAETASVFGEMLVFQRMTAAEEDPRERLGMLVGKIEDTFATVYRQIAMNRFEHAIHQSRRAQGELSADRFADAWTETQEAMFQGSVTLTDDYRIWWSYIPHFVHTPGYVYAYSFGELLVLALYARYQSEGGDFGDRYIEMLSAGGSDWPHDLMKPLGVDLTDPGFWNEGVALVEQMVSDAEKLAAEIG